MSVLNGCVSAIVCYLAVEIFNISQCGLRDMMERSAHVTRIGMALHALQDTVDVGLRRRHSGVWPGVGQFDSV
jgi:hypothetical protein